MDLNGNAESVITHNKMINIHNDILKSNCFSTQVHKELNAICAADLKRLDLSVFEFARVYDDGTAFILYSDPLISEYVVKKQIHITAHVPESILSSQFWYLPEPTGPYSQFAHDIKQICGSSGWADYIERFTGYFDMYCFWSTDEQSLATNRFMNLKDSLEQFCDNFRDKSKKLLAFAGQDRFHMTAAMFPNFGGLNSYENNGTNYKLSLYLEKIRYEIAKISASIYPSLSLREQECIELLIWGKTARDIAETMKLSPRTIEMYLESIKNKLGCKSKSSIISTLLRLSSNLE